MKANGREIATLMKDTAPAKKPKSIVRGMKAKMRILTGNPTSDSSPILYRRSGRTKIWVEIVAVANSRSLNLGVINCNFLSTIGETKIKASVARKESWNEESKTRIFGF